MSFLNTTHSLRHATPLPEGTAPERGIELLQGHEFLIQCDPHMIKYEAADPSTADGDSASAAAAAAAPVLPVLPEGRGVSAVAPARCYSVTDRVHALPAGLWDSDVVSTYEFINIERGVFVRIRSPLNTTMETVWEVRRTDGGGAELVEDIVISCSRLLMGVVKSTCETGWRGIHDKMVGEMSRPR